MAIYWWGFLFSGGPFSAYVFLGLLFFTAPMGLIIFGINDIADRDSDAINPRKGGIDGAVIKPKEIKMIIRYITISATTFLLLFLIGQRYLSALALAGIVLFAYTYSVEPFRLKTRPVIDAISNGFWLIFIYMLGLFIANVTVPANKDLWLGLSVTFLAGFVFHSLGTVLDYDTDEEVGEKTIGLLLGRRNTLAMCAVLLLYCTLVSANATLRIFFGLCTFLNLILLAKPDPILIAKFKTIFFYILAVVLPAAYLINRFIAN